MLSLFIDQNMKNAGFVVKWISHDCLLSLKVSQPFARFIAKLDSESPSNLGGRFWIEHVVVGAVNWI